MVTIFVTTFSSSNNDSLELHVQKTKEIATDFNPFPHGTVRLGFFGTLDNFGTWGFPLCRKLQIEGAVLDFVLRIFYLK